MHGRLSSFQKTMFQWDGLHPYNAVHAVRLAGSPQLDAFPAVLNRALVARGLAGLSIRQRDGTYSLGDRGPLSEFRVVPIVGDDSTALVAELERQLNARFHFQEDEVFAPFRFFVVPAEGAFWLGLAYFHAIADADSIVRLLSGLAKAVQGRLDPNLAVPLDRHPPRPERLMLHHPLRYLRALLALPGAVLGTRRACRVHRRAAADARNQVQLFSLGSECLEAMQAAGHAWGVTFNDLVLTALFRSLSPLAERRRRSRRRREIGLGVIVNLRRDLGLRASECFGLMLGSFRVGHEVPEAMTVRELAVAVNRQTRRAKKARSYLATSTQLWLARGLFERSSPERRRRFYAKHYPLWGGVTNVRLGELWPLQPEPGVLDYCRAVSTGPATPLVLSCTTVLNRVNFALSYQSTLFGESELVTVRDGFVGCLEQLPRKP